MGCMPLCFPNFSVGSDFRKSQCPCKLFMSPIWALNQPTSPGQRNEQSFFPSAKWLIDCLLHSLLILVSGPWQAPDLPTKGNGETLLLLYLPETGLLFFHEMQMNTLRIRVRIQPEEQRNVTGLSLLSQGTVWLRERSHVRGSLRYYLLKSYWTMTCRWYHLYNLLENKHLSLKKFPKETNNNNTIWIGQRHRLERSLKL